MIGFYVHHHGRGHAVRCHAVAAALDAPVVGIGTGAAPPDWPGAWESLPADDDDECRRPGADRTANGVLHWAPTAPAIRRRAAALSRALDRHAPRIVVVDVSVEAALLVRLHGIPIVAVAQPGVREDAAHATAHRAAAVVLAPWPGWAGDRPWRPTEGVAAVGVGAIGGACRPSVDTAPDERDRSAVALLVGGGGHRFTPELVEELAAARPDRTFHLMGDVSSQGRAANVVEHGWIDDVAGALATVGTVITHAGQTAVATVASTRTPAVLVPQPRPFREQESLAAVLAEEQLASVVRPGGGVPAIVAALESAEDRCGQEWARWHDGLGPTRAAGLVCEVARAHA